MLHWFFRLEISLTNGKRLLTLENSLMLWLSSDFSIENSKTCLNIRAHALFFECKGSTCALLINLPILGLNSCLDCFSAIKEVTLLLFVLSLDFDLLNVSVFKPAWQPLLVFHNPMVSTHCPLTGQMWTSVNSCCHRRHLQMRKSTLHYYLAPHLKSRAFSYH